MTVEDWTLESAETLVSTRIFAVRRESWRSPRDGTPYDFAIVDAPDWVNVVAVTDGGRLVMIRQFRVGTRAVTLEIPGGGVEAGEDPLAAAQRELAEETGYVAPRWTSLGAVEPNPAFQTNRCHAFLAEGAVKAGEQRPDEREDIAVEEVEWGAVPGLVTAGAITHGLVLNALYRVDLLRRSP